MGLWGWWLIYLVCETVLKQILVDRGRHVHALAQDCRRGVRVLVDGLAQVGGSAIYQHPIVR